MITIKEFYPLDSNVSVADVQFGEETIEVRFWGSYFKNLSNNDEIALFLQAEALKVNNQIDDAKNLLSNVASGEYESIDEVVEVEGQTFNKTTVTDTRNWAKIWIDKN